jgi:hypothetical protein
MLYEFDKFWKTLFFFIGTWIVYGLCGFEFTVVTLLTAMYLKLNK